MKNILTKILVLSILALSGCTNTEEPDGIMLNGEWKFKPGDDLSWAAPETDDASWATIMPSKPWEDQGYEKLDGYAWYRIKFNMPSSIRDNGFVRDSLQIRLGKIDDCDQVFLNGALIGENGEPVAQGVQPGNEFIKVQGQWNVPRRYVLSVKDPRIRWDQENTIAVRVYDQDGLGGMFSSPYSIGMVGLKDYIRIDASGGAFEFKGDTFYSKVISVQNISKQDYSGVLTIDVRSELNGNPVFNVDTLLALKSGSTTDLNFSLRTNMRNPAIAVITFTEGASGISVTDSLRLPYIQTPPVPKEPRINGPLAYGVRPYSPFLFRISATGEPPLRYFADNLPEFLKVDEESGRITGYIAKKGTYLIELCVENDYGHAVRQLRIEVGDKISLTPPLGWNSWNCWGLSVSDQKVRKSAWEMVSSGLADHGWTYINIDDGWEDKHVDGVIVPNSKFPDMKGLADFVHSKGLKIGIYSSPGPYTCGGYVGSYTFEESDAKSYAAWGFDYLKYDWCSYFQIAPHPTLEQMKYPYKLMHRFLRATGRDIHFSLCQYGMGDVWKWGAEVGGNSWRTTGDITDSWESLSAIGFDQGRCSPYAGPGHWNDPDMLVVGWVGWGPALHYTRLTPDEQYTHISLWCMLASPLLIGCDLSQLDPFTMNLLTNDEVLAVNQDTLGIQAIQVQANPEFQVWKKPMADGSVVVGLFNMTEKPLEVPVDMRILWISGVFKIRDLWKQEDLGKVKTHFGMKVLPHGVRMVRLWQ
jgi:alpha-galactosidase